MDEAGNIVSRIAMLAVYIFGAMSVLAICYAGFMYMTAAGDPQKSGQARNALFGAIGGMIIVGVAFMVPRLISETVIEPSGGASIGGTTTVSCDQVFKNQLVRQQAAGSAQRMNQVKVQVQQRQSEECAAEVWDPVVITGTQLVATSTAATNDGWAGTVHADVKAPAAFATAAGGPTDTDGGDCAVFIAAANTYAFSNRRIGGLAVPPGLQRFTSGATAAATAGTLNSGRDGENNIVVYFSGSPDKRPSDGAPCWMYVERLGTWISGAQS